MATSISLFLYRWAKRGLLDALVGGSLLCIYASKVLLARSSSPILFAFLWQWWPSSVSSQCWGLQDYALGCFSSIMLVAVGIGERFSFGGDPLMGASTVGDYREPISSSLVTRQYSGNRVSLVMAMTTQLVRFCTFWFGSFFNVLALEVTKYLKEMGSAVALKTCVRLK
eukprot:Gb_04046 [translate_table: standard]